jgi:hypothetical protein
MPVFSLNRGVPYKLLDADSTAAPVNGAGVFVPHAGHYEKKAVTWRLGFATAPSAVNVVIQVAQNDVDGEYVTIDTSTATAGESRVVAATYSFNFIRARVVSRTGGTGVTVEVTV